MPDETTSPLFVRLPTASAEKLSRAAFELKTPKRELVADLVDRYLGAEDVLVGPGLMARAADLIKSRLAPGKCAAVVTRD